MKPIEKQIKFIDIKLLPLFGFKAIDDYQYILCVNDIKESIIVKINKLIPIIKKYFPMKSFNLHKTDNKIQSITQSFNVLKKCLTIACIPFTIWSEYHQRKMVKYLRLNTINLILYNYIHRMSEIRSKIEEKVTVDGISNINDINDPSKQGKMVITQDGGTICKIYEYAGLTIEELHKFTHPKSIQSHNNELCHLYHSIGVKRLDMCIELYDKHNIIECGIGDYKFKLDNENIQIEQQIFRLGHTCYDFVITFKEPLKNVAFKLLWNDVIELESKQISDNVYKITTINIDHQLNVGAETYYNIMLQMIIPIRINKIDPTKWNSSMVTIEHKPCYYVPQLRYGIIKSGKYFISMKEIAKFYDDNPPCNSFTQENCLICNPVNCDEDDSSSKKI